VGNEIRRIAADEAYVEGVLADGARTAREIAAATMVEVRRAVGCG
jgi:hypothetical protein